LAFREVRVFEVREVLRLWVRGKGLRSIEGLAGVDRKTVRRYVEAAVRLGLSREGGEGQLSDGLMAMVLEAVRPYRVDGHGEAWRALVSNHEQIKTWLEEGLTAVKVTELLSRRGVVVPKRTVQRYAHVACGHGRGRETTVRVADGEPGAECQVDFGRMGLVFDSASGRRRVCHALIFTACFSRHCFVWLSFTQTTAAVIDGCEAAWSFFGGVFAVAIPDNLSAVIDKADPLEPRFNQAFVEYAQSRGFLIDPARVRRPQDKALSSYCTSWVVSDGFRFLSVFGSGWSSGGFVGGDGGDLVVVLAFVVECFADEAALAAPGFDGAGVHAHVSGDLLQADQSSGLETIAA
jgi:transposase